MGPRDKDNSGTLAREAEEEMFGAAELPEDDESENEAEASEEQER